MCLHLRKAEQTDMDLLYEWANDAVVRKNAFHTDPIPYEKHVEWFAGILEDTSVHQYILYQGKLPVGQIRLNVEGGEALIDYSISADYRGMGYGSKLLKLIKEQVLNDKISDVIKLTGRVKYENPVSARVFEKCGYTKIKKTDYIQYEFLLKGAVE